MNPDIKRIVVIGDIHGDSVWKKLLSKDKLENKFSSTLYVFVGDYFDSFVYIPPEQIRNFDDLLSEKSYNPENIILLLGNHDYHYLPYVNQRYSGYSPHTAILAGGTLKLCVDQNLLQVIFQYKNLIVSHAGITKTWLANSRLKIKDINSSFLDSFKKFEFQNTGDMYGNSIYQSPLWVRPESLRSDSIPDCIQIVGHSGVPEILIEDNIVFLDCLQKKKEVLEILISQEESFTTEPFRTITIEQ